MTPMLSRFPLPCCSSQILVLFFFSENDPCYALLKSGTMSQARLPTLLRSSSVTFFIAAVWVLFAVYGKLVPLTPTHQQIVARVFGEAASSRLTHMIGLGELLIAVWVLSGIRKQWCGWFQIVAVTTMNCIELLIASDILMWGNLNGLFALIFVLLVYWNMASTSRDN